MPEGFGTKTSIMISSSVSFNFLKVNVLYLCFLSVFRINLNAEDQEHSFDLSLTSAKVEQYYQQQILGSLESQFRLRYALGEVSKYQLNTVLEEIKKSQQKFNVFFISLQDFESKGALVFNIDIDGDMESYYLLFIREKPFIVDVGDTMTEVVFGRSSPKHFQDEFLLWFVREGYRIIENVRSR